MELRHLRYFIAVAEERSFLAAAARLRVAQSALSKQVRDLEDELGATLFERGPRGVNLTASGRAFLVEARRTLDVASRAVATARGAARAAPASCTLPMGSWPPTGSALNGSSPHFTLETRTFTSRSQAITTASYSTRCASAALTSGRHS